MPNTPFAVAYPSALDDDVSLTVGANNAPPAGTTAALNASIGTSDATITATGCVNFPAANGVFTTSDGEIIYYAAMVLSAGVYTFTGCLRGQDGTSPATHAGGIAINVYETHGQRVVLTAAVKALEAKLGTGSSTPVTATFLKGTGTGTSAWSALSSGDVTTALGYTPVNAASATTFSAAGTALTVTNDVSIGGRLSATGLIGLNGTTVATSGVHIWGGVMSGASQYGLELIPICSSGASTAFYGLYVNTAVGNISFTQINNYGIYIGNPSKGALATITNAYGLYIENVTVGGSLNYSLYCNGPALFKSTLEIDGAVTLTAGGTALTINNDISVKDLLLTSTAAPGSPANGEVWYDSTTGGHYSRGPMGSESLSGVLYTSTTASTLTESVITTTETAFTPSFTIPAGSLTVGKILRITILGTATISATGVSAILNLRLTNGATHTNVLTTGTTAALWTTSVTNQPWRFSAEFAVTAIGASGNIIAVGRYANATTVTTYAESTTTKLPGNATGTTVDTTISQAIELSIKYSTSTAGNSVTVNVVIIEALD